MEAFFLDFFGSFARIIIFLHVLAAAVLIGGMVVLRFVLKPTLVSKDKEEIKFARCLQILDNFLKIMLPFMLILISASWLMRVGLGFAYASPIIETLLHVKEALWMILAFNFSVAYWKFLNAKAFYKKRAYFEVGENISLIINYLIPVNLVFALIGVYLGVIMRGY
ncbi:MAG: hypothetical protein IBX44_07790 [Sulfurospirillum sp.]|nr:hypothetical protein [Sulfurospirillum sp.]